MKPAILKKWVKALRSGKYKQGEGQLKKINGIPRYCCLGVLCDLYAKKNHVEWRDSNNTKTGYFLGEQGLLPCKVMHWAGLNSNDPVLKDCDKERTAYSASDLNDNGKRFTTIARLIEQAQKKKLI